MKKRTDSLTNQHLKKVLWESLRKSVSSTSVLTDVYVYVCCRRVKSHLCVCLCMSERVSEKWLLALLITHRWVFTIRKGELERKWWTPCVVDESAPEVTVYRHTVSAVVFQAEKKEMIVPSHIPLPSSCLTDYTSASDCLISCWIE